MPLLTWSHFCSVGVRAMDEQHGILMDAMNELRLASVRGCGRDRTGEHLNRLIQLIIMHFQSEERLLEQNDFPRLAEHRAAHQRLLNLLRESTYHARWGVNVQLTPLLCSVRDGYLEHFDGPDKEYGPWLNARGVD